MEIKINRNEKGKVLFQINDEAEREFTYDNFDHLIDLTYNNNEEIKFVNDDELSDYKQLLNGIITESRKEDDREAVNNAINSKSELEFENEFLTTDTDLKSDNK